MKHVCHRTEITQLWKETTERYPFMLSPSERNNLLAEFASTVIKRYVDPDPPSANRIELMGKINKYRVEHGMEPLPVTS